MKNGYVDDESHVTDAYRSAATSGTLASLPDEVKPYCKWIHKLIEGVWNPSALDGMIENGSTPQTPENRLNENFTKKEFQELWNRINHKYAYTVNFESKELIEKAIAAINKELEAYNMEIASRPTVIAANKIDAAPDEAAEAVELLKAEFEPKGIQVFPISAVSGQGLKELLYHVSGLLDQADDRPVVFEQEYFPELENRFSDEPFSVTYDEEEDEYVVEGPRIEKMLGYTNLDSEKGFTFFQNFLKETGILEQLEALGIEEGSTVRMYGLKFDYYK